MIITESGTFRKENRIPAPCPVFGRNSILASQKPEPIGLINCVSLTAHQLGSYVALGSNGGTLIAVRPAYRSSMLNVRSSFLQLLACPQDHSRLRADDDNLVCEHRHRFNVEEGIPILIDNPRREATPRNMEPCHFI